MKKKIFFFFFLWKTNEADLRQQLPLVSKFLLEIIRSQRSHQLPKCRRVKGSEATLTEEQFHEKKVPLRGVTNLLCEHVQGANDFEHIANFVVLTLDKIVCVTGKAKEISSKDHNLWTIQRQTFWRVCAGSHANPSSQIPPRDRRGTGAGGVARWNRYGRQFPPLSEQTWEEGTDNMRSLQTEAEIPGAVNVPLMVVNTSLQ